MSIDGVNPKKKKGSMSIVGVNYGLAECRSGIEI